MDQEKIKKLQELKELLDTGILSQQEFEVEKEKVLSIEDEQKDKASSKPLNRKKVGFKETIKHFVQNCQMDDNACKWISNKWIKIAIALVSIVFLFKTIDETMMWEYEKLAVFAEAVFLMLCAYKTRGVRTKAIIALSIILIALVCFINISSFSHSTEHYEYFYRSCVYDAKIAFYVSFAFVIVINLFIPIETGKTKRIIYSILLAVPLNPLFWCTGITGGIRAVESYSTDNIALQYYEYLESYTVLTCFAIIGTLILLYLLMTKASISFSPVINWVKNNTKTFFGLIALLVIVGSVAVGVSIHNEKVAMETAAKAAAEKAYNDSVAAVKKAEIDRKRRIEKARRDSIAYVQKLRNDSIDKVQHQPFVKKYANVGLIITNLRMTNGRNKDGENTKGISFSIFNPTKKTIKYVVAVVTPMNVVKDRAGYTQKCRGIGPVAPCEIGSWSFDDVFADKNNIIDDLSVSFEVIYTNGSSKRINWKDAYVTDYKASWFM